MIRRREKVDTSTQKGFTLLEGVITALILIIVAAMAVPAFQKMAINGNLKAAARDLVADFMSLKQKAMSENTVYTITFSVAEEANNYTIQPRGGAPIQIKTPAFFGSIRIFSANFGGRKTITFQTRGTSSAGNVVLTNSRNSTATITINFAGRIHVHFDLK